MAESSDPPRVLLVEDDEDMRRILTGALERAGCRVIGACDGSEALIHLRSLAFPSFGPRPDLIVTDMCLPCFSGFEVLETVRLLDRRIPVIVVSAFVDSAMIDEARRLRATEVVTKPFDVERFVADTLRWLADPTP